MKDNLLLLKLLADETRLNILNILMKGDSYVEKIACDLELTPATICYHLKKMESANVVRCSRSQFYIIYSLNRDVFDKTLIELIANNESIVDPDEKYKKTVLSHFFRCGRLIQIPMQRKKREIVLAEIAKKFESGRTYSETEVNNVIHTVHEDHCTIRREMIACGLMARDRDVYRIL